MGVKYWYIMMFLLVGVIFEEKVPLLLPLLTVISEILEYYASIFVCFIHIFKGTFIKV